MKEGREKFGSRLGFILMSAGCAIGVGNVWKFPFLTGQNGGGAFVLFYVIFLILFGIPVMTVEFTLGRASQKSPVYMCKPLEKEGQKWHWQGWASLAGNVLLMMYYLTVAGWILKYFVDFLTGALSSANTAEAAGEAFGKAIGSPWSNAVYILIVVVLGCLVCSFKLQGGLEKVTKYMMLALLVLMIALAVNSLTLEGTSEGLKFYLLPDFSKVSWTTINAAMNQAFFTLSLGIGSMAIFGSYLGKDRSLLGESVNVIILDTVVAICAGLIIFPACYTYGVEPDAGPPLLFITLTNVFNHMNIGRLWGTLMFLFMTFAAFSTVLAVFENIMAMIRDITGWSRIKSSVICGIALFILGIPCELGFNVWSGFVPFAAGTGILDLEDFLVSNILLPLGSLFFVVFATWKAGWGWDKFEAEANQGNGWKVRGWMKPYIKYVLPIFILFVFIMGIISFPFK